MKGRYPVCCLFLEIDPAAVDVNIHPSKREVKFHRESEIRKFVAQAIKETLLAFHTEPGKTKTISNAETQRRGEEQIETIGKPFEIKAAPELSTQSLPEFPVPIKARSRMAVATRRTTTVANGFFESDSVGSARSQSSIYAATCAIDSRPSTLDRRNAAAQRPAPARRRHRQTLCPAGIRPRTGVARPARGARADFVRADDEPHRAERFRAVAKIAVAGNHRTAAARRAVSARATGRPDQTRASA